MSSVERKRWLNGNTGWLIALIGIVASSVYAHAIAIGRLNQNEAACKRNASLIAKNEKRFELIDEKLERLIRSTSRIEGQLGFNGG